MKHEGQSAQTSTVRASNDEASLIELSSDVDELEEAPVAYVQSKPAVYHGQSASVQAPDESRLNVFTSLHQAKDSRKASIFKESKKPASSELVQGKPAGLKPVMDEVKFTIVRLWLTINDDDSEPEMFRSPKVFGKHMKRLYETYLPCNRFHSNWDTSLYDNWTE